VRNDEEIELTEHMAGVLEGMSTRLTEHQSIMNSKMADLFRRISDISKKIDNVNEQLKKSKTIGYK